MKMAEEVNTTHYYHRDGGNNSQSQYQQQNDEHNEYSWNIREFTKPDSM